EVDKALARERQGRERIVADAPPVSPLRRLMLNSMFYLPIAAALGAFVCWKLLDPYIADFPVVRGDIVLINAEPFGVSPGVVSLTVGSNEVLVDTAHVRLEPGAAGEPAFESADALKVGDRIEVAGLAEGTRLVAGAIRPTKGEDTHGGVEK